MGLQSPVSWSSEFRSSEDCKFRGNLFLCMCIVKTKSSVYSFLCSERDLKMRRHFSFIKLRIVTQSGFQTEVMKFIVAYPLLGFFPPCRTVLWQKYI